MPTRTKGTAMTEVELAYMAGIIDGEGCVNIWCRSDRKEYRLRLSVTNCDLSLMLWIKSTFGGYLYRREAQKAGWKTKYEWMVTGKLLDNVLPIILPYLKIKRRQAELAVCFRKSFEDGKNVSSKTWVFRKDCYCEMKNLNHSVCLGAETKRPNSLRDAIVRTTGN